MEAFSVVKDKDFYKTLAKLALPVALQQLISLCVVMLDNVMVASLGDLALSSVSQANQVTVFFTFIVRGVSGGAALMISQYWGKKDVERIKQIFAVIFQVTGFIAVAVNIFVFFCPELVLRFFTNDADIIVSAQGYIKIVSFSYLLFALADTFAAMLRCVEIVKITFAVSVFSLFTNLFLNYSLIGGNFGFPALGIEGAAIATVISRGLELAIVMVFFFCIQKRIPAKSIDLFRVDKLMYKDYAKYGLPILIGDIQWGMVGVFKSVIIGRLGVSMISAANIADTIMQLGLIFSNGLASAACVVIGKTVGVKNYELTRKYSTTIQIIFVGVGVVMSSMVFLLRDPFVSLYDVSSETSTLAAQLIAIGAITLLGTSYHVACFTGINRGAGDSKFVFKVDMICGWLVMLPLSFLTAFVFKAPLPVIFIATRIDQCFKWIVALIRLKGDRWITNIVRE
ncbi:MAG: MATE family efflux transporter [Ruminococcaceae bacterium]|nr:MATE family efflux transporter [Oscillospiraceae bacterium]